MRRALVPLLLVAVAAGAFLLLRPRARPSVLLITIDTMRADAAGVGKGTPAIEEFLRRSTHFRRARTTAPLTLPAHLSLLSGLLPARHGIHDNVAPRLPKRRPFPLLQEEFAGAGYETAAFVACSVLAAETGIGAGFGSYDCPPPGPTFSVAYGDLPAEARVEAPLRWLRERGERPHFTWVHFYDPHAPYAPFPGDARRERSFEKAQGPLLYAGEVRRVDAAIERLLAAVPPETIVILASDHGEGLFEHDEATHGPLCYATTADAFLAVAGPGMRGGAVDDAPRSLCDVAPTLRRWCGLPPHESDGAPLDGPALPVVLTESLHTYLIHGWGQAFSASDGRFTLVESGRRLELFDRSVDPGEVRPLPLEESEAYERLSRALEAMRGIAHGGGGAASDAASPYGPARRAFGGYLPRGENAQLPDPREGFPRWILMESASRLIYEGYEQKSPDRLREAIALLRELGSADPRSPASHYYLLHAFARLAALTGDRARHADAARSGRLALELGYQDPTILREILGESLASEDLGEIRASVEAAVRLSLERDPAVAPVLAEARARLAGG